ncbi:hypothetical protein [Microbacterium sp.]|uniref:hypothetical protein n=1 Tax=Microbacterium sp. TaxID=51671 RepID=UPI0039E5136F
MEVQHPKNLSNIWPFLLGFCAGAALGAILQTEYALAHPDTWYLFFGPVLAYVYSVGIMGFIGFAGGAVSVLTLGLQTRLSARRVFCLRVLLTSIITWTLLAFSSGEAFSLEMIECFVVLMLPQVLLAVRTLALANKER